MLKICMFDNLEPEELDYFKEKFTDCEFIFGRDKIKNCDVIYGNPDMKEVLSCENLKWVQTVSAGLDRYVTGNFPENVVLTSATGAYGMSISEHLLAMHLNIIKNLNAYHSNQLEHIWQNLGEARSVFGETVLVLGLGDIGGDYAKLVKSMGAYVIGVRRSDTRKPDFVDELYLSEDLDKILPRADVIAIAMPGTSKTKGMVNKEFIAKMKDNAVILNIGRGAIIDTEAMCDALECGKLAGVGLDVTDPEPLPKDHRLWDIPTALITPHISGGHASTRVRILKLFEKNLENYLSGNQMINIADLKEGYRKIN